MFEKLVFNSKLKTLEFQVTIFGLELVYED